MKILFLDIDGVLNSTRSTLSKTGLKFRTSNQLLKIEALKKFLEIEDALPYGPTYTLDTIDPVAVDLINRLFDKEPNLYLVLSSSHRSFFCGSEYNGIAFASNKHLEVLRLYLEALGLSSVRLIDITPRLYTRRGIEVKTWLDLHPEVTRSCAVDDGNDFEKYDCELVLTSAAEGLSSKDYFELTKKLAVHESTIIF